MNQKPVGKRESELHLRKVLKKTKCYKCFTYQANNFFHLEDLNKERPWCISCKKFNSKRKRNCLRCGKEFLSKGNHNRICCRMRVDMEFVDHWER